MMLVGTVSNCTRYPDYLDNNLLYLFIEVEDQTSVVLFPTNNTVAKEPLSLALYPNEPLDTLFNEKISKLFSAQAKFDMTSYPDKIIEFKEKILCQ